MTTSDTARRSRRRAVCEVLSVGVLGLIAPLFISTPLSATDTHFTTVESPPHPTAAPGR